VGLGSGDPGCSRELSSHAHAAALTVRSTLVCDIQPVARRALQQTMCAPIVRQREGAQTRSTVPPRGAGTLSSVGTITSARLFCSGAQSGRNSMQKSSRITRRARLEDSDK